MHSIHLSQNAPHSWKVIMWFLSLPNDVHSVTLPLARRRQQHLRKWQRIRKLFPQQHQGTKTQLQTFKITSLPIVFCMYVFLLSCNLHILFIAGTALRQELAPTQQKGEKLWLRFCNTNGSINSFHIYWHSAPFLMCSSSLYKNTPASSLSACTMFSKFTQAHIEIL